jgi:hypothetical protein
MAQLVRSGAGAVRGYGSRALAEGVRRGDAAFLGQGGRITDRWLDARMLVHRLTGGQFTPQGDIVLRRWTPAGEVDPRALAHTFRSSSYDEVLSTGPRVLHRSFADHGTVNGQFWSRDVPTGPLQTQLDVALLPEWNTTARIAPFTTVPQATHRAEATMPAGRVFFEGPAGPQVGVAMPETRLLGGGGQVVFPGGVPAEWLTPGVQRVQP